MVAAATRAWERFSEGVCRRSFSSPEALLYEAMIARALCELVSPLARAHLGPGPVLDVGCGGGRLAASIATACATTVVGVDPSAAQMRRVARRHAARVHGARAVADGLPFADARFGSVVSSCAVKHWPDDVAGFRECLRVARPGAPLVIVEIDGGASVDDVRALATQLRLPAPIRSGYVRFAMRTVVGVAPRPDTVADALRRAGACDVEHYLAPGSPLTVCVARRG